MVNLEADCTVCPLVPSLPDSRLLSRQQPANLQHRKSGVPSSKMPGLEKSATLQAQAAGIAGVTLPKNATQFVHTDGGAHTQATLSLVLGILNGLGIQATPDQPLAEAGIDSLGTRTDDMLPCA